MTILAQPQRDTASDTTLGTNPFVSPVTAPERLTTRQDHATCLSSFVGDTHSYTSMWSLSNLSSSPSSQIGVWGKWLGRWPFAVTLALAFALVSRCFLPWTSYQIRCENQSLYSRSEQKKKKIISSISKVQTIVPSDSSRFRLVREYRGTRPPSFDQRDHKPRYWRCSRNVRNCKKDDSIRNTINMVTERGIAKGKKYFRPYFNENSRKAWFSSKNLPKEFITTINRVSLPFLVNENWKRALDQIFEK